MTSASKVNTNKVYGYSYFQSYYFFSFGYFAWEKPLQGVSLSGCDYRR